MRIWSEIPRRRTQELVADIATLVWVVLWVTIGVRLYGALASLADVGTGIQATGNGISDAGDALGAALSGIPLVGQGAADLVRAAFAGVGAPLVQAGADLERLLLIIAAVLGLLLVAVALIPWLNRYLPWRVTRWQRLNAGDRAIRRQSVPEDADAIRAQDLERVLAERAMYRLEYADLLEHSPSPIGDFLAGRYDRLAQAELASVGLQVRHEGRAR